jgi:ribosomal protein S18 acetylase RimI-like enzyme
MHLSMPRRVAFVYVALQGDETAPHRRHGNPGMPYVRRYRMEIDLATMRDSAAVLPEGYLWLAWHPSLMQRHASAKFHSFHDEIDSRVFPCLGSLHGCHRLMQEISRQETFLPSATWLITQDADVRSGMLDCGTIQGLAHTAAIGAVQNVGVHPDHRGLGLGRALVLKALEGFRNAGLRRVYLEVTGDNSPAVELYRSVGFEHARTMYKVVEAEPATSF